MLEKLNLFHLIGLITLVLLKWKRISLLSRKNHLLRCWDYLSLLILIFSIDKTAFRKIGAFICSTKFLAAPSSFFFKMLDKLKKWICRIVRPSLAASLEPWTHLQNLARFNLLYRYYFGRCSHELEGLVSHTHSLMLYGCLCQQFFPLYS